jgi:low affinity Fe/Cu permease
MMKAVKRLAMWLPESLGTPYAFLAAILLTVAWLIWGLFAPATSTWLLVPSAIASVVTFLIAFSLQYTQNRDTRSMQLKLDEVLRAADQARTSFVKLERLSDEELERIEQDLLAHREGESRGSTTP